MKTKKEPLMLQNLTYSKPLKSLPSCVALEVQGNKQVFSDLAAVKRWVADRADEYVDQVRPCLIKNDNDFFSVMKWLKSV